MDKKIREAGLLVLSDVKLRLASIDKWCQSEFAFSQLNNRVCHYSPEATKWSACGALWASVYKKLRPQVEYAPLYEERVDFAEFMEGKLGELCDQMTLQKFGVKFKSDSPYYPGVRMEEVNDLHPVFMKRETCYAAVMEIFNKVEDLCR